MSTDPSEQTKAPSVASERPAWLPSKFRTPEDLAKSYTELERKMGRDGGKHHTPKATEPPPASFDPEADPEDGGLQIEMGDPPEEAQPPPVIDREAERREVAEAIQRASAGNLDPKTLETLESAGIDRNTLQAISGRLTEGAEALRLLAAQEATREIGGLEVWQEVESWAAANLSADDLEGFNKMLATEAPGVVRVAVKALHRQMLEADGPRLISGSRITGDLGDVFTSRQQLTAAQSDRRYSEDPAYRAEVEAKILRSDFGKFKH